ncbi:hypothetical protein VNO78_34008 [Psophocarpus tetragonolobus]|uniref:DRBM domain-containing protein n=1 Tax=Psophocarpus tetragonolobus TaxID=3891 RepID=A0AAN9NZ39_PSOTE
MFKKKNLSLPEYTHEWEDPLDAMRFKCKVTVDGCTYESDKFYSTLKDVEHAAAEVALMVLPGYTKIAQKEGFRLPIYSTNKFDEVHMRIFVSQVEVEGEFFTVQEVKSKKQAEIRAVKKNGSKTVEGGSVEKDGVWERHGMDTSVDSRTEHALYVFDDLILPILVWKSRFKEGIEAGHVEIEDCLDSGFDDYHHE